jgi:hypothetical protein
MTTALPDRDERTEAIENAGYRLAYFIVSFGALAITAWRSFARHDPMWELLALVILGGVVGKVYEGSHGTLSSRRAVGMLATAGVAAVVAAVLALVFWWRP